MNIIYGKGTCYINSPVNVRYISIKYRGLINTKHKHKEIIKSENNKLYIVNMQSKSIFSNLNNNIGILYKPTINEDSELFKYIGEFRIISAKVNDRNIPVEVFGVDYPNLINSKPENMGKPENYKGNYKFGRVPRKKTLKGRKNKTLRQLPKGGY